MKKIFCAVTSTVLKALTKNINNYWRCILCSYYILRGIIGVYRVIQLKYLAPKPVGISSCDVPTLSANGKHRHFLPSNITTKNYAFRNTSTAYNESVATVTPIVVLYLFDHSRSQCIRGDTCRCKTVCSFHSKGHP